MGSEIDKIREAILRNRAGLEKATDSELLQLWRWLPPAVRQQYLEIPQKTERTTNAVSHKPAAKI